TESSLMNQGATSAVVASPKVDRGVSAVRMVSASTLSSSAVGCLGAERALMTPFWTNASSAALKIGHRGTGIAVLERRLDRNHDLLPSPVPSSSLLVSAPI